MAEPAAALLPFALRRLRRGWRSGELLILAAAIAVAVASHSAVTLFGARVSAALAQQTGDTLGADLIYSSRQPLPADWLAQLDARGLRGVDVVQFPSVVFSDERSALASIKAVAAGFPLRGRVLLADQPFGPTRAADGIPAPGEAWADQRLLQELGLDALGGTLQAGALQLRLRALVAEEPGRGAGFADLAPRLLINLADLPASGLVGEGSRAQYAYLVTGSAAQLGGLQDLDPPHGVRRIAPQDARPELQTALRRAGEFLGIARLAAALLAAAAIALCAWQYALSLRDEVALLKCLGAQSGFILRGLLLSLLLLGALGGLLGIAVGYAGQAVIAALLAELMQIGLPPAPLLPLAGALGLALLLVLGFAAPPLLQARATPPVRVFQRAENGGHSRGGMLIAVLAVGLLLWWQTDSLQAAGRVLGGAAAVLVVLALLGGLLLRLLAPLRNAGGMAWRFGLGNIARRRGQTVGQVAALGLALLALLLVTVVRQDLLDSWRKRLPAETPNQFLINVQPEQVQPLQAFFAARGFAAPRLWPMARGRLTALNGQPVSADTFDDPETQRWINRDFNLSWTDTLGADNRILEGDWWGAAGRGQPWLSADTYAVERLDLKLGDTLSLDFAGQNVTLRVTNTREVDWDSFQPNFFLLAPPGVLDGQVPTQWLTSFYLAPDQRGLLRELVQAFPNITALDLDAIMQQVRGIMDRIVRAVEFIFLFTLAAGLMVLLAAIEGTRAERVRETALLRALGAPRGVIRAGLLTEYAVLGAVAGGVAALAAQGIAWVLAVQVFQIPYGPRPLLWLAGAGGGALLVAGLGYVALRGVLGTPPARVLQEAA